MSRYWGVRIGEGGKYVDDAKSGNYIAIGWNELGDLNWLTKENNYETLLQKATKLYGQTYPKETKNAQSINRGQLIRFVKEINRDDIVLVPDSPRRKVLIGRVVGDYQFIKPSDQCPYFHRREVQWIKTIDRDDLPQKLRNSIGSLLTVFNLDSHQVVIDQLIGKAEKKRKIVEVTGDALVKEIIDRLFELSPREFEELVKDLLGSLGFEAAVMEYVGDKGVDVIGTLNAEGLVQVTLRVQVKRVSWNIGIDDVLRIRGALGTDEHGAIITTSSFTRSAQEEAQQQQKKPISLIDGETLAELLLRHYDELDTKYKELLKLHRKEIPLKDTFYTKA